MSMETPEMSAEAAREFDHFSVHNAVRFQQACPEGTCEAYRDIFTYCRWRAQGYQVQKGQSGWPSSRGSRRPGARRTATRSRSGTRSGPCCSAVTKWQRPGNSEKPTKDTGPGRPGGQRPCGRLDPAEQPPRPARPLRRGEGGHSPD
jgi:hypothetical protein